MPKGTGTMPKRGCGSSRVAGGIYAFCGMSPVGKPLEHFIIDPPIPVTDEEGNPLQVKSRGVTLFEYNGVWHILDKVGSKFYPNVLDYLEEVRLYGLSRRLPGNLDFSKLTRDSRIFMVHERGLVKNLADYERWCCPKQKLEHRPEDHPEACAGVWWEDIEFDPKRVTPIDSEKNKKGRNVMVKLASGVHYHARLRPARIEKPEYQMAIIARFPIMLQVVKGPNSDENLIKARKSGLRVEEVEE